MLFRSIEILLDKVEKGLGYPVIVKPVNLGSSVGISVAKNRVELTHSVDDAFKYATKVLVEHAITNLREINCSVLGDENDAIASECEEPLHTKDILSYEDKYVSNAKGSGSKGMAFAFYLRMKKCGTSSNEKTLLWTIFRFSRMNRLVKFV